MAAVVPMFVASPAGAATGCTAGMFPATFAAQSGVKVACHTDAGTNTNHIDIHEGDNVVYHHGAAHNVNLGPASGNAVTAGSATIKFAAGTIKPADLRRPISSFNAAKATVLAGGSFIRSLAPAACTTACTSAVLSQKATVTGGTSAAPLLATIEQTNNRFLDDVTCGAATSTLTSATAGFVATDVGKSVSGGPFADGTRIISVTATVATMNQAHTAACTAAAGHTGDQITIGAVTYVAGVPQVFNNDPMALQLTNTTAGGQGLTCTGSTLSMTAGSKLDTGGFNAAYIGLTAVVKGAAATPTTAKITAVNVAGNTSATIAPACPAGVTASNGFAAISTRSGNGPGNGGVMMSLGAALNLNPALVATQDDCNLNTFEGFMVMGGWTNPGAAFAANAFAARAAVSQVIFPTSVLSFNGYVVPKRGGDSVDANPHYNFSFPLLPTSLAVCLNLGAPANDVELTLGINPVVISGAPFLPTGSGNGGDPPVRQLLPTTGTFTTTVELILNPSSVVNTSTDTCTISASTAIPGVQCGDG